MLPYNGSYNGSFADVGVGVRGTITDRYQDHNRAQMLAAISELEVVSDIQRLSGCLSQRNLHACAMSHSKSRVYCTHVKICDKQRENISTYLISYLHYSVHTS